MTDQKTELKAIALTEKIGTITSQYEDHIADLRADLTLLSRENEVLRAELDSLRSNNDSEKDGAGPVEEKNG